LNKLSGYLRENGTVGFRNIVLVIPSVACVNHISWKIAENVSGAVNLHHEAGCAQIGDDYRQSMRTLIGVAQNPNVGAVLVVGLGCERVDPMELRDKVAETGKPVECIIVQKTGGTNKSVAIGTSIVSRMARELSQQQKTEVPLSSIVLGVECGGSDFTSPLASNPAVGGASDYFAQQGGRVIISEITELIGAENILAKRCTDKKIAEQLRVHTADVIKVSRSESRDEIDGEAVPNNISPGNVRGGLTTIEEKSLGAVSKGGKVAPIVGFIDYGESVGKESGLYIMNTPGFDPESVSGMVSGGANVVVFTTGQGTPTGSPVAPVIKVTGNRATAQMMEDDMDIDVSEIIEEGVSIKEASEKVINSIIAVANGMLTKSESFGYTDFIITRIGPRL